MKIKIVGHLRLKTGFHIKEIKLDRPTILRDLITIDGVRDTRLVILVNDIGGSMDQLVSNDDYVKILPVVGGG